MRPSAASSAESRVSSAKLHRGRETNLPSKLDHNVVRPLCPSLLVVPDEHSAQALDATRHLSLCPPLSAPHHEAFSDERFGVCGRWFGRSRFSLLWDGRRRVDRRTVGVEASSGDALRNAGSLDEGVGPREAGDASSRGCTRRGGGRCESVEQGGSLVRRRVAKHGLVERVVQCSTFPFALTASLRRREIDGSQDLVHETAGRVVVSAETLAERRRPPKSLEDRRLCVVCHRHTRGV